MYVCICVYTYIYIYVYKSRLHHKNERNSCEKCSPHVIARSAVDNEMAHSLCCELQVEEKFLLHETASKRTGAEVKQHARDHQTLQCRIEVVGSGGVGAHRLQA